LSELPSGTVTFLFTDIEGSTRLLKKLRERYGDVRTEHDRIMRAAFMEAGGQEVDTQGDAFFVAFRRARDAVASAVAGQRSLAAHAWPDGAVVRVRMGIHTGEPTVGQDRYVGLGVHRAARICSAAHGGQVLLSNTTRELVEDDLPSDVGMRDVGEHALKDIDRPERLFQLVVAGLPNDFPPPRSAAGEAAELARGRERELAEAADAAVGSGRRWAPRKRRWTVAAAMLVLTGAAIVGVLATRGGSAHARALPANAVGLIAAHGGRVRESVAVDAAPTSVAVGDGAVWVTNADAGTVSRIDLRTKNVLPIQVGNSPNGIAVGGGGVWVANHDDGTVSWINPQSNTVVKRIRVGNGPTAVTYGYRSVWVTNSDDRTLSRIDANTGTVVHTIRTNAVGRGVTVGAGSVWVTDEATRTVVEVDPAKNLVTATATVGSGPAGVVYGDGAVWVANELDGTVSEIDPSTLAVQATIPVAGSPSALAYGDGGLWVSVEFGQRVVRIDPHAARISAVIRVGNRPEGLAAVPGGVWVAAQASGTGHRGGRLVVLGGGLDSIDPALANNTDSTSLLGVAYDALTSIRRVGGAAGTQLVPDLATTLPLPTNGGRSYTFRVRSGIRYSDGSWLRPQDFRRALERMFTLGSPYVVDTALGKLLGASRCRPKRPCDLSRGVVVNGPDSLTFRLSAPDASLPFSLEGFVSPVPRGTPLRDVGMKAMPSTGPYAIESYVPGRQVTLVRNRYFRSWSQAARPDGYPDEIVWRIGVPPDDEVRQVTEGKADVLFNLVPNDRVQELAARFPRQLHLIPQRATAFAFLNTRRAPFDDIRVRRALNYAVDRKKMATLHGGLAVAQPTCQIVAPVVTGYRRYCPYTVDAGPSGDWKAPNITKARALVAASGTKGTKVVVWTFPYFGKEGRYLVSLLRSLGYQAKLKELGDLATYFNALDRTPTAQAGFAAWFGYLVAADVFSTLNCHFPGNNAHFCDPRIDAQVRHLAAEQASDPNAGATLAARIDRELTDRAPWVPLFTPRFADFVSSRVGNYQANTYLSSSVLLDQLWVR
jgi:peptide/nickel transport system substrate-binding protein